MGSSQKRAIQNYRSRLGERGLARFEALVGTLIAILSAQSPGASRRIRPRRPELRAAVSKSIAGESPKPGGILAALRRSPLVGADLDLSRPREEGRKVDL